MGVMIIPKMVLSKMIISSLNLFKQITKCTETIHKTLTFGTILLTHHMSRLGGRGDHHGVADGQSQEEVGDVGKLQAGWRPIRAVTWRRHR